LRLTAAADSAAPASTGTAQRGSGGRAYAQRALNPEP